MRFRVWLACAGFAIGSGLAQTPLPVPAEVIQDLRGRDFDAALRKVDRLLERQPDDARLWTLRGLALAGAGRARESLRAYEEALRRNPDSLPALQGAAEIEFRANAPAAADRLARVLAAQPDNPTAHAMLGSLAHRRGACDEGLRHFDRSGQAAFSDPVITRQFAECSYLAERFAQAADLFERLAATGRVGREFRYNQALSLHAAGSHEEAARILQALTSGNGSDQETLSLLAEAQRSAWDIPGAVATLQSAVRAHPRSERFYLQLAELCMEHGNYDLGLEVVEAGVGNLPDSPRLLTMQGVLQAQLGFYERAEEAFRRAAELEPDERSAALGLSITLQRTGRAAQSIEVLRQRARQAPDDAVTAFLLAQALIRKGVSPGEREFEEARVLLERAVPALPAEAAPRVELGKVNLRSGRVPEAVALLREAVQLDPADRVAAYQLMIAFRRAGKPDEAAELARRVRERLGQEQADEVRRNRFRLIQEGAAPPVP